MDQTRNTSDYSGLKALFFNGTLKRSPETSNTDGLINISRLLMEKQGVSTKVIRTVDHDIASGVYPDMTEYGWATDAWPDLYPAVQEADIVVVAGPIWLGDNSSQTKKLIERLYAHSGQLNSKGQWAFYPK
ncbi:flavodoxin family protein, partial [Arthrobacter sp. HMWF013]|uniref:flavodoxin family protein n=1 Tax=Arthrobacter sp. HMWF013 TaxID=2056849 RepID=UPI000D4266E5